MAQWYFNNFNKLRYATFSLASQRAPLTELKGQDIQYDDHDMGRHSLVQKNLIIPLSNLAMQLKTDTTMVPLFFIFDEISNLIVDQRPTVYLAFRRVTRLFNKLLVWSFVLSTQSQPYHISPAAAEDRSSRVSHRLLERCEPFHAFPLDVEADRLFGIDKNGQMAIPLAQFSRKEHVTTFGRPLWMAYKDETCEAIRGIVGDKLLCTTKPYYPGNKNHLLAVLSRISLDPCLQSEEAVQLEQTAIDSHLRLILGYDFKMLLQFDMALRALSCRDVCMDIDGQHAERSLAPVITAKP